MAEIVGVVASGISLGTLAAQIASSIIKLKSLWDELRDAPDDIKDLIEEAEMLNNILLNLDDGQTSPATCFELQQSRMECLRHCRAASKKMSLMVEDLHAEIEKSKGLRRKIVSAKLIFRKDQVKKYKSRLKGTVRMLSLSEQCFTRAYQRSIHKMLTQLSLVDCVTRPIAQQDRRRSQLRLSPRTNNSGIENKPTRVNTITWEPSPLDRLFGYFHCMQRISASKNWDRHVDLNAKDDNEEHTYVRYRPPSWLTNQVWEICNLKARNTWTCHLRVYNVIPHDSLVFEFIRKDNIDAVKSLFSKGLASPFDRSDVGGETALHVAASHGRLALCKLLLEAGADADIPSFSSENTTPFHELCFRGGILAFKRGIPVTDLHRLFLTRDVDILTALHKFRGPKDAFQLLLEQTLSSGLDLPLSMRVDIAIFFSDAVWHNTPGLFRMAMGPGLSESAASNIVGERGMTTIQSVFRALAQSVIYDCWSLPPEKYYDVGYSEPSPPKVMKHYKWVTLCHEWSALLAELLHAGADLHRFNHAQRTPLLEAFSVFSGEGAVQSLDYLFHCWLKHAEDAGVDLLQFGETEARLHTFSACNKDFFCHVRFSDRRCV